MRESRCFLNLIKTRVNLPLPEPERSEALEYFNFVDFEASEFLDLLYDEFLTAEKRARLNYLRKLSKKFHHLTKRYEYYFETVDDGYDDPLIQRYLSTLKDKDSYCLSEEQREIAMDLIELQILNEMTEELENLCARRNCAIRYSKPRLKISPADEERVLKWRYLNMKYGRQKRLEAEEREKKARQRRIDAACLGGGFSVDW
ncbi:MAG: hypothetical protein IJE88_08160 [Akkermansia sp.]|nr:hypothetical protein [Akkermansia sp.]